MFSSYRKYHPEHRCVLLVLSDQDAKYTALQKEGIEILSLETLARKRPELFEMAFYYNAMELCCALKPFLIRHILDTQKGGKVFYLDSDLFFTGRMTEAIEGLNDHSILLTPHFVSADTPGLLDGLLPTETAVVRSGLFNLGFFGVSSGEETDRFLEWWSQRLLRNCVQDRGDGILLDQSWCTPVPILFERTLVLKDKGYNVAYWNLHERSLAEGKTGLYAGERPLVFFHFSGFSLELPHLLSRHQNRHHVSPGGALAKLIAQYLLLLYVHSSRKLKTKPTTPFAHFDNGIAIPPIVRSLMRHVSSGTTYFGNPFRVDSENSFFEWMLSIQYGSVPPLLIEMRNSRPDLRAAFPDPLGTDAIKLLEWVSVRAAAEFELDKKLGKIVEMVAQVQCNRLKRSVVASVLPQPPVFGVNLVGFHHSPKGVGAAVRADAECLNRARVPHGFHNVTDSSVRIQNVSGSRRVISLENPYRINLIHMNAADMRGFYSARGPDFFRQRYNIGYWVWELPSPPSDAGYAYQFFDEIWVPSRFVQNALLPSSPVPVVRVPHSLPDDFGSRAATAGDVWDLIGKDKKFTVLYCFDYHSIWERKNPEAVVRAFKAALGEDPSAQLVIKCLNADDAQAVRRLKSMGAGGNVRILDQPLSEPTMQALFREVDCYLSLHRAEGFGLTLLESMALGTPVIATNWSGNTDFLDESNSFPVRYDLVKTTRDHGVYPAGSTWAEPDVEHAAEQLLKVRKSGPEVAAKRRIGKRRFLDEYAVSRVSRTYLQRLEILAQRPPRYHG